MIYRFYRLLLAIAVAPLGLVLCLVASVIGIALSVLLGALLLSAGLVLAVWLIVLAATPAKIDEGATLTAAEIDDDTALPRESLDRIRKRFRLGDGEGRTA